MNMEASVKEGVTVIALQGRLDTNTAGALETKFTQLIEQGAGKFVFDLASLGYISSAGLRSMLFAAKKTKSVQGKLVLARMNEQVRDVFDMSGFSSIFTICSTEREAIDAAK